MGKVPWVNPIVNDATRLLNAIGAANASAQTLLPLVYDELRRLAAARLASEKPGQTLQATALVHEAWIKLTESDPQRRWNDRTHFFAAAAEAMRRILIDIARRKKCARHGGGMERVELETWQMPAVVQGDDELLAIHESLDELAMLDARKAELVKLRFFVGLGFAEAAEVLGISEITAKRDWAFARAWLFQKTSGQTRPETSSPDPD